MKNEQQLTTFNNTNASFEELKSQAAELVRSGYTPLNSGNVLSKSEYETANVAAKQAHEMELAKAVAVAQKAKELNIPIMAAFDSIYPIPSNGGTRLTIGYHLANLLLKRAGCVINFTKNHEPLCKYITRGGLVFDEIPSRTNDKGETETPKQGYIPKDRYERELLYNEDGSVNIMGGDIALFIYDWITECQIIRQLKQLDGTFKEITHTESYSWLADQLFLQGQAQINKNYKIPTNRFTYPKAIYKKIAFMNCARWIGDDLLYGMIETGELLDATGQNYEVLESGEVSKIYNNIGQEIKV